VETRSCGPGGNSSRCRWGRQGSALAGDNQVPPAFGQDRGRAWRGRACRLGSSGPVWEARTSTCCLRAAVGNPSFMAGRMSGPVSSGRLAGRECHRGADQHGTSERGRPAAPPHRRRRRRPREVRTKVLLFAPSGGVRSRTFGSAPASRVSSHRPGLLTDQVFSQTRTASRSSVRAFSSDRARGSLSDTTSPADGDKPGTGLDSDPPHLGKIVVGPHLAAPGHDRVPNCSALAGQTPDLTQCQGISP
jgi:hypothetical protein